MKIMKIIKKTDIILFELIESKINSGNVLFTSHALQRMKQRNITELAVLSILAEEAGATRRRNKKKDVLEDISIIEPATDWKYCIEGEFLGSKTIRIIVTFSNEKMPIITVINI